MVAIRYNGQRLGPARPILTGIPNGFVHDGGRLLFAPDGSLFVSTGETGDGPLAQDPDSLGGRNEFRPALVFGADDRAHRGAPPRGF